MKLQPQGDHPPYAYSWRVVGLPALLATFTVCLPCGTAAADDPKAAPADTLEAIVVKSEKLSVETLLDRKVYSVQSDAQSTFGSLSDILSNIPSVDVDPTGIVSLRGDTKVLILIDGKPSTQFAGAAAGDNLQSIPAQDIERIEVLTTPPAQFKADGAAGVINIITRKKRRPGASGSMQASAGNGGRYVLGTDESYSSGGLSLSASAGYRTDIRQRTVRSSVVAPDPGSGQRINSTSAIAEKIRRATPSAKFSADYALNERQSISGSAGWVNRGGLRTYTELNQSTAPAGLLTDSTRRLSAGHDPQTNLDQTLGFAQKLGQRGDTLDLSLHRSTSHQHERYDYANDSFVPAAPAYYNFLSFHEINETTEFGADYGWSPAKTHSLKLGYSFEQDNYRFGNVGANVDPMTGIATVDPTLTNEFKFRQQIHAVYASYQTTRDPWTWLAGLRMEEVHTDAQQLTNNLATSDSYFDAYPSLHLERSVTPHSSLSFGASRRVARPQPDDYNPYVDYEYTPNLRSGNPRLKRQLTQSYETGYGYEAGGRSYGVTGYYRLNRNSVTDVTEYLANGFSLATKANLPRDKSAGIELSASGRVFRRLTSSLSANLFRSQIDASALGSGGLQSTAGINGKMKLDYRPIDAASAQVTFTRTDKRLTPQGYIGAVNIVNLGYTHHLNSALFAVLTVTDLFNGQRIHRYSTSSAFTQEYLRTVQGRIVYAGLTYSFGSAKKDKQPELEFDNSVVR